MKKVSNEHGVSFQPIPLPSRSHISRQCSCSPSSYLKIVTTLLHVSMFAIGAWAVLGAELNFGKEVEFHLEQISGMGAPTSRGAVHLKMGYRGSHSPNGAFPGKLNETKVLRKSDVTLQATDRLRIKKSFIPFCLASNTVMNIPSTSWLW